MKCRSCGIESPATLCNTCFLDEVIGAVGMGEDNPSKILKGMVSKYGRLRNLKRLPSYKLIFGPKRARRVITTEEGIRCRLVSGLNGWIAVSPGPETEIAIIETPEGKVTKLPGESVEGGRVITYYEGSKKIREVHTPTSLVFRRRKSRKRSRYVTSGPPHPHMRSPLGQF